METTTLHWHYRGDKTPDKGHRILVISPEYEKDDPFRTRIIDSQFFEISIDAKYWCYITEPFK